MMSGSGTARGDRRRFVSSSSVRHPRASPTQDSIARRQCSNIFFREVSRTNDFVVEFEI